MQFSITVQTKIDDWQLIKEAEELGFDAAWVPDTQMVWSDCYATMALAAANTSRIKLGTGVSIAGVRIAPVTAHSIATINQIAPGRTFLGMGTGHTAMRAMGMNPMPLKEFAEYLRVLRALLHGEEVEYTYRNRTRNIAFLHEGMGFRNTDDPVPIYVAANGPKALQIAGQYGDGLISAMGENPETLAFNLGMAKQGADAAGRSFDDYHTASITHAVVLRPGETLKSDRVIEYSGSWVVAMIHFVYEIFEYTKNEEMIPEFMQPIWEDYCDHVAKMPLPPESRARMIHDGQCTYYPKEERRFITPEMIEGACMVGGPSELAEQIRKAEAGGLKEISLLPPMDVFRDTIQEFARDVVPLV
jgi:alkanesulfonate monooxygenase SsuD/methylene tetrahydromethanopterin reductase-like flavin-dependent oxidoreductase (luciferase family)